MKGAELLIKSINTSIEKHIFKKIIHNDGGGDDGEGGVRSWKALVLDVITFYINSGKYLHR